jgi:hypothetical protein
MADLRVQFTLIADDGSTEPRAYSTKAHTALGRIFTSWCETHEIDPELPRFVVAATGHELHPHYLAGEIAALFAPSITDYHIMALLPARESPVEESPTTGTLEASSTHIMQPNSPIARRIRSAAFEEVLSPAKVHKPVVSGKILFRILPNIEAVAACDFELYPDAPLSTLFARWASAVARAVPAPHTIRYVSALGNPLDGEEAAGSVAHLFPAKFTANVVNAYITKHGARSTISDTTRAERTRVPLPATGTYACCPCVEGFPKQGS